MSDTKRKRQQKTVPTIVGPHATDTDRFAASTTSSAVKTNAEIKSRLVDDEIDQRKWRRKAIDDLLRVFYILNGSILAFIVAIWIFEASIRSASPIVTEKVLLTLIGASTVQLGALAGFVGRSLAR